MLAPCFLVSFEEGQPPGVYADEAQDGGKKRWRLVQGVGPGGLELDKSRTGRIHKPTLKQFRIDTRPLKIEEANGVDAAYVVKCMVRDACAYAEAVCMLRGGEEATGAMRAWQDGYRPVLGKWEDARNEMIADEDIQGYLDEHYPPLS